MADKEKIKKARQTHWAKIRAAIKKIEESEYADYGILVRLSENIPRILPQNQKSAMKHELLKTVEEKDISFRQAHSVWNAAVGFKKKEFQDVALAKMIAQVSTDEHIKLIEKISPRKGKRQMAPVR